MHFVASRASRSIALGSLVVVAAGLLACDKERQQSIPVEPAAADAQVKVCDLKSVEKNAKSYFPGKGPGSQENAALDLLGVMANDCAAGSKTAYTAHWFQLAGMFEDVLEAGTGGPAADGASVLGATIALQGSAGAILDPCAGAANCAPWDGYPTPPNFAAVLGSNDGAWGVVATGSEAVCSSFQHPCSGWNADLMGDAWGAEPSVSWQTAFAGRPTLVFGHPIPGPSPTGEPLLATELPAFQWLLIPDPNEFGVNATPPAVLEVGLCSTATPTKVETLVQKGQTILTEAVLDWCTSQITSVAHADWSLLDRLVAFFSPSPLAATVGIRGPGGSAGGFTDFYAVDLSGTFRLAASSQPADAVVGQQILGVDGNPLVLRAFTSSMESPLENASVTLQVIGNGGLIPSGNGISGTGLNCQDFVCTGRTQADQEPAPGTLALPLVITKPGSYSFCFQAQLPPLVLESAVCTEKFNVRP